MAFDALSAYPEAPVLALRPYVDDRPPRFFSRQVYQAMVGWLMERDASHPGQLRKFFVDFDADLSAALLFLRQINTEEWHDRQLTEGDDYDTVSFIDRVLHPAYLRLTEGVFAPLIRPVAHASRLDRGKSADGLDVFNIVEELRGGPMELCTNAYHATVRNGIGHGGITLLHHEIRYRDKRGNTETVELRSVVRLCDDMVDTCNGLAAALKVFSAAKWPTGYPVPHEILVESLMEETRGPTWSISGCIPSELGGTRQLITYAHPRSHDLLKVQWAAVHSAAVAARLAPGYDRYFFSLRDSRNRVGWAAFDGSALAAAHARGALEVYEFANSFQQGGFFFDPKPALPRFLGRADTFLQMWRQQRPLFAEQMRVARGLPAMECREARAHRNAWGYVLNGTVVMPEVDIDTAAATIRRFKRRIIATAASTAFAAAGRFATVRYLPLAYARIAVVTTDFRRRRLVGVGLVPEVICTVQLQRLRRIRAPDIFGSTVESEGGWRIAWSRAWLESGGVIS